MTTTDKPTFDPKKAASNLLAALDLMELGIELQRQRIARENPTASPEEVNATLQDWIQETRGHVAVKCNL